MAEEKFVIDAPDGAKIYGILNYSDKKKNDKAVIHVHGLAGDVRDYAAVRMAFDFPRQGYDVIRIYLYSDNDGGRSLVDCTLKQHAADINTTIRHFKKKYKKLFATGHSYGGPSLMESSINSFAAVSLWDPSYLPQKSVLRTDFVKAGKFYVSPEGIPLVVGEAFLTEAENFDRKYAISLARKCKAPLQVIYGGKNAFWIGEGESFHTHAKGPSDEHVIKKSQHCFYEEGTTAPLLRYTRQWFDRF